MTGEPMENIDQLQMVVAEVQAARQQVSSVRAQIQELEGTIAAVQSQPDGLALHRQLGGVLIEVADRAALINELNETLTSLRTHMERFAEREKQLIETYDELKQSLQGA
ncbi:MAG: prefoldin subunit [Poseidonia sp.]